MRYAAALAFLVVLTLALGACGNGESGTSGDPAVPSDGVPGGIPPDGLADLLETAPSGNVPALGDTTGMTVAQLEAKVEEIEKLADANMEEMRALTTRLRSGGMDQATSRKLMQVTADGNALRKLLMDYDKAIDALDR